MGGSADEAKRYIPLFSGFDVIGFDYKSNTPWEAENEFPAFFDPIHKEYGSVILIANSIGAYFAMQALDGKRIKKAFFISPVLDMEGIITGMMANGGISEDELRGKGEIITASGQVLSYKYLCYAREHPTCFCAPSYIIYGENDTITPISAVYDFAEKNGAEVNVMEGGEHWFHTDKQLKFVDSVIKRFL